VALSKTAIPTYLQETDNGVYLSVKVQPRASRNEIASILGKELKVCVTTPPVDSAANRALIEFIAERLEVPRNRVELVRGGASRHKKLFVRGLNASQVAAHLAQGK
jgi:uncharacterized protein (TIGR00251 family)